jgi:hypothetical protein
MTLAFGRSAEPLLYKVLTHLCNIALFRPWYVEAATPDAKDVVLVKDISESMDEIHETPSESLKLLDIAKEAAKTVIKTLNPNDRVGYLATTLNLKV